MSESNPLTPPRIGQPWAGQGGKFIGTLRGNDGGPDWHIVAADADGVDIEFGGYGQKITNAESDRDGAANTAALLAGGVHPAAKFASEHTADGHSDFYLPSRHELRLMYVNAPEGLDTGDCYWSSTQYSAGSAWMQGFYDGDQLSNCKDYECRVRPVRRVPAQ